MALTSRICPESIHFIPLHWNHSCLRHRLLSPGLLQVSSLAFCFCSPFLPPPLPISLKLNTDHIALCLNPPVLSRSIYNKIQTLSMASVMSDPWLSCWPCVLPTSPLIYWTLATFTFCCFLAQAKSTSAHTGPLHLLVPLLGALFFQIFAQLPFSNP